MTHSVAEFAALLVRAARGAGVPIHQAKEFAGTLSFPQTPLDIYEEALVALKSPRALPDFKDTGDAIEFASRDPLYSLPAALDLASSGAKVLHPASPLTRHWSRTRGFDHFEDGSFGPCAAVRFSPGRIELPSGLLESFNQLAMKIYVPATADSRDGAGAGNIDND